MKVRKQTKGRHTQVYTWYRYVAKRLIHLRPIEQEMEEEMRKGNYWVESEEYGFMYGVDYEKLTGRKPVFDDLTKQNGGI
jgi:hypothetical protein